MDNFILYDRVNRLYCEYELKGKPDLKKKSHERFIEAKTKRSKFHILRKMSVSLHTAGLQEHLAAASSQPGLNVFICICDFRLISLEKTQRVYNQVRMIFLPSS